MRTFKAGDRVRVSLNGYFSQTRGTAGVVTHLADGDGDYRIRRDGEDDCRLVRGVDMALEAVDTLPAAAPADDKALEYLKAEISRLPDKSSKRLVLLEMLDAVYGLVPQIFVQTTITFTPKG